MAKAPAEPYISSTEYYHSDHLGTASWMTNSVGTQIYSATYLPYGYEFNASGPTTNHYKPGSPANRFCLLGWKFTGKERDAESNLDYFGARYYAATQGRWLTPDWSDVPTPVPYADLNDPQTLNLYGYTANRPITNVDADGHCFGPVVVACVWAAANPATASAIVVTVSVAIQANGERLAQAASNGLDAARRNLESQAIQTVAAVGVAVATTHTFLNGDSNKKQPPNPHGSKGDPNHQNTADEEAAKMGPNGQREVRVKTPGGEKETRVIDAAKVVNGKVTEAVQVIRPKKNGTPPAREVRAARDIEKATGVKPKMVPVRVKKPDAKK